MKHKLNMSPDEVVEQAVRAVKRARNHVADVEFSCEDAGRSELDFLCRIIEAAIDAGATTINIPDTVGYAIPHQFGNTMAQLLNRIPNADKAIFSVHCHNDLGLAVANSLAAVSQGARQVECTINGLGERAGNASLEEIVMAVRTRQDYFNLDTRIDATHIVPASRLVSTITGFPVQPNKAIVGANAFAHESGIHQDGVLKHRETYEIMKAEDVGWHTNSLGVQFGTETELNEAFARFKALADLKHEIFDEDLQAIASNTRQKDPLARFGLVCMKVSSETGVIPKADLTITMDDKEHRVQAEGSGPVDATFKAIESLVDSGCKLQLYSVNNITSGTDSQGEVTVRLERGGRIVNGLGADTDIIVASVKAYIAALNLISAGGIRHHPQEADV
jgi:2-isopropylmalate synthase